MPIHNPIYSTLILIFIYLLFISIIGRRFDWLKDIKKASGGYLLSEEFT